MIDVKSFIENELENTEDIKTLNYLNSLTDDDIDKIEYEVLNDDELRYKIEVITKWYVYHYK